MSSACVIAAIFLPVDLRCEQELDRLTRAWAAERQGARERFAEERKLLTLAERCERNLALRDLVIDDTDTAPGGRILLWIKSRDPVGASALRDLRVSTGDPVLLWWETPDEPDAVRAVLSRRMADRLGVVVENEVPERFYEPGFRLDRESPEVTFDRGARALARYRSLKDFEPTYKLFSVLLGVRDAGFDPLGRVTYFDSELDERQQTSVFSALRSRELALVVGPPGTGKTRTLCELVRQCVARGERVLVTAASNTAVDNLAERLVDAGVGVVRIGHPARVSPAMEARCLDVLLEQTEAWALARKWTREGEELRRRAAKRSDRGSLRGQEKREVFAEARALLQDARMHLREAQKNILSRAPVLAVTASGADAFLLGEESFDRVVLDEATQCPDPIALAALARAPKAVLAGDPQQLPPTVIAQEALTLGLGSTFFERVVARGGTDGLVTKLRLQHRMHEAIMEFPSRMSYDGSLIAAPEVAKATLVEAGVRESATRPGPFVFVDASGRGWDDRREGDDPSTRNPEQAEHVALEVRTLLERGVAPKDVGVITPYHAQVRLLRELLVAQLAQGLEVSTVDGFQGREKLVIVVDLVRSNEDGQLGFLEDLRRMNVAITRAKRFLLVVGDGATLARNAYYKAFVAHAEATGAWRSAWESP